ncbi:AAA family ATPase [Acidipropionibacterium jensenii]|uniref:AAA family ATPase n=1 Tax=Acidipropionibacterium jensenii TaxID=1749 RepID=UPI0023B95281|nr:AAA family ATPase [Acidipropionibacterium jensenii]
MDAADPGLTLTAEFVAGLDLLDSGSNMFLTGKAGTGKSTLIRLYLEHTDRRTITVAPTGIAALNVDGYTIHRLFSFPKDVSEQQVRGGAYYPGRFAKTLSELETLIVDEASMVRADLFDAMVAALERFGPHPGEPFGGVQLVLVGDLYQLPPVVTDAEGAFIDEEFGTPYFFSGHSFTREAFPTVELTTVFRQIGDDQLVRLLNGVREGALLDDARAQLNARSDPDFEPDPGEFWLTLATTNRIVGARNRRMLELLGGETRTFNATVTGETDGFEHPAEDVLKLAVGAQVMLLNNEPAGRWVNGSIGRIESIREDVSGSVVEVRLRNGDLVEVRRHVWDITRPVVRGGSLVHEIVGTFSQLPMKLAWAITIHKSQGQTLDHVVVDLTGGTFANGQLYVALSRCTSLDGLVLKRPVLPKDLKTDVRVRRFLNAASNQDDVHGRAYVAALFVGHEGDRYRPRPVEIAVVTAGGDSDEATTVVNPTMDLYSAQTEYGITTRDVQLAPLLTEAWAALSPLLAGRTPVGVDIDRTLGLIDSEIKRNGIVQKMPLGAELPAYSLAGPADAGAGGCAGGTALALARGMRDAGERLLQEHPDALAAASASAFPVHAWGTGYLLARTTGAGGCRDASGFTVGGDLSAQDDPAQVLADALAGAWTRVIDRDAEVVSRLRDAESHFGVQILPDGFEATGPLQARSVLVPGARVCFTGEVVSQRYGVFDRGEMQQLALDHGLAVSENMTKTKTDVLVVAQRGTQSGKAKKAAQWGKPVLAAEEFLEWARGE